VCRLKRGESDTRGSHGGKRGNRAEGYTGGRGKEGEGGPVGRGSGSARPQSSRARSDEPPADPVARQAAHDRRVGLRARDLQCFIHGTTALSLRQGHTCQHARGSDAGCAREHDHEIRAASERRHRTCSGTAVRLRQILGTQVVHFVHANTASIIFVLAGAAAHTDAGEPFANVSGAQPFCLLQQDVRASTFPECKSRTAPPRAR